MKRDIFFLFFVQNVYHGSLLDPPLLGILSPQQKGSAVGNISLEATFSREARWPSGRASDSGARGRGFNPQYAVLCP